MKSLGFKCSVSDCKNDANYRHLQLCQKHYFRKMRNGNFELNSEKTLRLTGYKRKYRISNPAGYQKIYSPEHKLANQGYVYEHRFIIYKKYGELLPPCEICKIIINWESCHIDHIDNDPTNNQENNLRPLCNGCNTARGIRVKNVQILTIEDITLTIMQWSRRQDVVISHATIKRRLKAGYSPYDAVYAPSKTHPNMVAKKVFVKSMIYNMS